MSVPTFVASASASLTTAGTGPLTCNVPTGKADGDLLIAHVAVASGGGTPTTPGGWTFLASERGGSAGGAASWVYARLASSEPTSYDWSVSASSEYNVITHCYRPASGSWSSIPQAVGVCRSLDTASAATHAGPELLPPSAAVDTMLATFMSLGRGSTTTTKPTGYTLAENPDSSGTTATAVESGGAYLSVSAGTAAAVTWTTSNGGAASVFHLALFDPGEDHPLTIRHFAVSIGTGADSTSIAVACPYYASGDLLMMAVGINGDSLSISTPSGWTLLDTVVNSTATFRQRDCVFYRVADGSEGASVTVSHDSGISVGGMVACVGAASAFGHHAAAEDTTLSTTNDIPALTMAAQSPWALAFAVDGICRGDRTYVSSPSGYTYLMISRNGTIGSRHEVIIAAAWPTAADPAAGSFTINSTAYSNGFQFATGPAPDAAVYAWGYIIG